MDEQFRQKLIEADAAGKKQFGDSWESDMKRLGEASGGLAEDTLRRTLADPNGLSALRHAGREARLQLLQQALDPRNGNPVRAQELEREYASIRAAEREAHRKARGR